jgi:hypothetical protein
MLATCLAHLILLRLITPTKEKCIIICWQTAIPSDLFTMLEIEIRCF